MTMREDCVHYESRTYDDDDEVARFCTLDLAPEAPWRCPDNCPKYERILMIGADFEKGSLAETPPPRGRARRVAGRHRRGARRRRAHRRGCRA